jgi:hypothetical protein
MRVLADPERDHGFRVEGLFELPLETQIARLQEEAGRFKKLVAGGASSSVNRRRCGGQRDGAETNR